MSRVASSRGGGMKSDKGIHWNRTRGSVINLFTRMLPPVILIALATSPIHAKIRLDRAALTLNIGFVMTGDMHFEGIAMKGGPTFGAGLHYFITDHLMAGGDVAVTLLISQWTPSPGTAEDWSMEEFGVHLHYLEGSPSSKRRFYGRVGMQAARVTGIRRYLDRPTQKIQTKFGLKWELAIGLVQSTFKKNTRLFVDVGYGRLSARLQNPGLNSEGTTWEHDFASGVTKVRVGAIILLGSGPDER